MSRAETSVRGSANADDALAAAIATVLAYIDAEHTATYAPPVSRWTRHARLESQGIVVTPRALRRGWSIE